MSIKESKFIQFGKKLYTESFLSPKDKKFLFLFFVGLFFSLFFLTFLLIGKNPYSLLIPFSLYDFQFFLHDKRENVTIYLSDGKGKIFPVQKKILKTGNLREDIKKILIEICEPPYFELDYSNFENVQQTYKKLPNIYLALIQIWIVNGNLILDFREETLREEMENQRVRIDTGEYEVGDLQVEKGQLLKEKLKEERDKQLIEKLKRDLLSYSFEVLEKTIFQNFSQIQSIEYRLDGKRKNFNGLSYSLERKNRPLP